MNRTEWIIVVVLTLATVLSLTLAPPMGQEQGQVLAQASLTATPVATSVARQTATPQMIKASSTPVIERTATPTPSITPSPSPTRTMTPSSTPTVTPSPTPTRWAFDHHPEYDRFVYVDQGTQHMYVFEHGELVRDIPCSTGLPDPDKYTEAWSGTVGRYWGTFFAFDVYADEAWYLYKSAGSILVHSLPYTYQNGYKVYQDREALGVRPASHGCVRIAPDDALWFTEWNPEGVRMDVSDPYREKWR